MTHSKQEIEVDFSLNIKSCIVLLQELQDELCFCSSDQVRWREFDFSIKVVSRTSSSMNEKEKNYAS